MSEPRVTSLISRVIMKKTSEVFPEEREIVLASTNLMRTTTNLDSLKGNENRNFYGTLQLLFSRNRELVHFSVVSLLNGGYAPVKVLVRAATENALCMRLFNKKPELATIWLKDPEGFRRKWHPKAIIRDLFANNQRMKLSYEKFYDILCTYVHPSSLGWREQISDSKILWRPIFESEHASECFGLIFFAIMQSFKPFLEANKGRLHPDVRSQVNVIMPKVDQMITRHLQVIEGKKP